MRCACARVHESGRAPSGRTRSSWRHRHAAGAPKTRVPSQADPAARKPRTLDYSKWASLEVPDEDAPAAPPRRPSPKPVAESPRPSRPSPPPPATTRGPPKVALSAPSELSAAELDALQKRLLSYLEPLRTPPPERAPANRLKCDLSRGAWTRLHADPPVYTCDDFLSAAECEQLIAMAEGRLTRSLTAGTAYGDAGIERTSSSCGFPHCWEACAPITGKIEQLTGLDWTHFENVAVSRYREGEQYTPHQDGLAVKRKAPSLDSMGFFANGGQRVATVLCYLNDVARGGATSFPSLGVEVRPKRGRCLLFFPGHLDGRMDEQMLHAAMPAVDTKWVTQVWVRAHANPLYSLDPPRWPRGVEAESFVNLVQVVLKAAHAQAQAAAPRRPERGR